MHTVPIYPLERQLRYDLAPRVHARTIEPAVNRTGAVDQSSVQIDQRVASARS